MKGHPLQTVDTVIFNRIELLLLALPGDSVDITRQGIVVHLPADRVLNKTDTALCHIHEELNPDIVTERSWNHLISSARLQRQRVGLGEKISQGCECLTSAVDQGTLHAAEADRPFRSHKSRPARIVSSPCSRYLPVSLLPGGLTSTKPNSPSCRLRTAISASAPSLRCPSSSRLITCAGLQLDFSITLSMDIPMLRNLDITLSMFFMPALALP